jgi:amidohydrolase
MSTTRQSETKTERLKQIALNAIEQQAERYFKISRELYDAPEIGLKEIKSSELLASELERNGFKVTRCIAGMQTAFVAAAEGKQGGPTVGILAEYDALPGIGHGCGHNIIGTASIAAALGVGSVIREIPGRFMLFGTPNEEGGAEGGKIRMVEAKVFEGVDVTVAIHPGSSVRSESMVHPKISEDLYGASLACSSVEIRFKGKSAHAAMAPELGINALDAVVLTFVGLNALRQHIRSDSRIHGIITNGGKAPNIIPDEAAAYFYVRSPDSDYMFQLVEKLRRCAAGAAIATGAELDFRKNLRYMETVKHVPTLDRLFESNLAELGEKIGKSKKPKGAASTDLGNVSRVIPTSSCTIAIAPYNTALHTKDFAEATISDSGKRGLIVAAKVLALTCIDLLTNPGLLTKARKEFAKRTR